MKIIFSYDNKNNKIHFLVNHSNITEDEITEVFSNLYITAEINKRIHKIVGHTNKKRFLVIIGIFNKNKTAFNVITVYPANRKYIIKWNNEVNKNE
jgi:hypothetical protein